MGGGRAGACGAGTVEGESSHLSPYRPFCILKLFTNKENASHYRKPRSIRKARKSYTLSLDSVGFLEDLRKKRQCSSTSSVLEEILQAARRAQGRVAVDKAVADYYTSLSPAEAGEQQEWGDFALGQFSNQDA